MLLKLKNCETFYSISMLISKIVIFPTEQKSHESFLRAITGSGKDLSLNYKYGVLTYFIMLIQCNDMYLLTEFRRSYRIHKRPLVRHQSQIFHGHHRSFYKQRRAWQSRNTQPLACVSTCFREAFRSSLG